VVKASYVLAAAIVIATLVPISLAVSGLGPAIDLVQERSVGTFDNAPSSIQDPKGDAEAVYQKSGNETLPQVRDYHDILGASVEKRGETFIFTINLAGNPNNNQEYESMYRWHIITNSQVTNREQRYTLMFPNFHHGNSTTDGWYSAIYDETVDAYVRPLTKIPPMPDDKVSYALENFYIGKFDYWVDVSVRLNATSGEPDYLMDYAPK